jgi:hypothetical protein
MKLRAVLLAAGCAALSGTAFAVDAADLAFRYRTLEEAAQRKVFMPILPMLIGQTAAQTDTLIAERERADPDSADLPDLKSLSARGKALVRTLLERPDLYGTFVAPGGETASKREAALAELGKIGGDGVCLLQTGAGTQCALRLNKGDRREIAPYQPRVVKTIKIVPPDFGAAPEVQGAELLAGGPAPAVRDAVREPVRTAPPVVLSRQGRPVFNKDVLERQQRINRWLRQHGLPQLAEDGMFGPDTEAKVCDVERRAGLRDPKKPCRIEIGGALDKTITYNHLSAEARSEELPQRGDKDRRGVKGQPDQWGVRLLQQKLNAIKYLPKTTVDGDFGQGTWERIRIFQRRNCLPGSDHLDMTTWQALEGASMGRDMSQCQKKQPDARPAVEIIDGETIVGRPKSMKADAEVVQAIRSLPDRFKDKRDLLQALIWQEGGTPEKTLCNSDDACGPAQITYDTFSDKTLGCKSEGLTWKEVKDTVPGAVRCAAIILEKLAKVHGKSDPITLAAMYNNSTDGRRYLARSWTINAGDARGQTVKHVTAIGYEICTRTGRNPLDPGRIRPEHRAWARHAENVAEATVFQEGGPRSKPECRLFPNPPKK